MSVRAPFFLAPGDRKVVGLVGMGHFTSHFYFLVLPPLFPLLAEAFGVSYTQLGFALAVMAATSAVVQTPVGFLVDRHGARRFLVVGLVLSGFSIIGIGVFASYEALLVLMVLFGLGDSVIHPSDYAILNKTVDPRRMGRAFSVHTFAGHLGFAAAPVTVIALSEWFGWREALVACGATGVALGGVMYLSRSLLGEEEADAQDSAGGSLSGGVALLLSAPMLVGFVFYAAISITGAGMTGFGITALHLHFDLSLAEAGAAVSAYLFAAPVGVMLSGWMSDRTSRHHSLVVVCFGVLAAAALAIAFATPRLEIVVALFALAGFFVGAVNPARDMLIRSMVSVAETGKAFGFVTIGLSAGGVVAPLLYGWILDHCEPIAIFWAIGAMALVTIAVVTATARVQSRVLAARAVIIPKAPGLSRKRRREQGRGSDRVRSG